MDNNVEQERTRDHSYTPQEGGLAGAGGGNIPNGGIPSDHSSAPAPDADKNQKRVDPDTTNASDESALGQGPNTLGDRDRPREHSGIENGPVDPMTSRAPDKVNATAHDDATKDKQE